MVFPLTDTGVAPAAWGPHAWAMIHTIAATYPTHPTRTDTQYYRAYFESLAGVLPCAACRTGYRTLIREVVPLTHQTFADRMTLFRWTVELHNAVNAKLGKPIDRDVLRWYAMYAAV